MTDQERREALVVFLFETYTEQVRLPSGREFGPSESWPEGWVAGMAKTPPLVDLDNKIAYGLADITRQAYAAWQASSS